MEDILADSDSDLDGMEVDAPKPNKNKIDTWIQEDIDSIVDFTDASAISKITATKPCKGPVLAPSIQKKDRGFKTSTDGRLIIADLSDSDDETPKKNVINLNSDSDSGKHNVLKTLWCSAFYTVFLLFILDDDHKSAAETAILGNKKRKRSDLESMRSGASSQPAMKYKAGGSGIHRQLKSTAGSVYSDVGSEYRAKKAKGDLKKKGKVDPYAYLPLTRKLLNKRYVRKI